MVLLSKTAVRWCVSFCIRCSCTLSQHNKNEEHSKEHSSFLVRCRSRHSVSKGPPDLSPKFFRFAQNLDTRVRVPTTQNNKNSEADKYLLRYFGTLEGTRTPDLLVRSHREILRLHHFKPNLILFSPLFPPNYSIASMLY